MPDTEVNKRLFLLLGESRAFLALVIGEYDLLHGGDKAEIVRRKVKDTVEGELQFFCRAEFALIYEMKQIFLDSGTGHIFE